MSSTTAPPRRPALLVRRRIATYFLGGVTEIPCLVGALAKQGCAVHELSVDIRDGVRESAMICTVMAPGEEIELLLARLRGLPAVVSSELG
ncbi:hypothetical protein [Amycolatopsis alkalitolerans]|uniref:ACT domain-containing protein n=1 Tax=Amycolatopsis alkalitolerans TaxID=2547244 RepID=A0A5C4M3D5_9PSEU|nr:hypothetical protein [Amycolatopsis alkalitolerans]TNC25843.1 hypothetical protein FG385_14490 [Amycolatopsis alkalitolerans]